jgi:pyrimidine-nucleoside phosphorylase
MRAVDIVRKKRDGGELTPEDLAFLVRNYCSGEIPDYQVSAFLMATFLRGMTPGETAALTRHMRDSGSVLKLGKIPGRKVDKHSTGGVGDKTSLVIAPVVAAAGVTVPMISGRGLGHTGGTLDKLESIPGFRVRLSPDQFQEQLAAIGVALMGQTENLVPADRKLYALRDVTATVESYPLIASSIMSKKLAEDIDGLVLDIKTGSGAFMKTEDSARGLARVLVDLGRAFGVRVSALITDMNQPLGALVGNALEIIECIEVLKGCGPTDLVLLCEELSAHCLVLGEAVTTIEEGRRLFRQIITTGKALQKFRDVVRFQGGNPAVVDDYNVLPRAKMEGAITAPVSGYIHTMDTERIGTSMCILGAGREIVESVIDPAVGMRVLRKIGDRVEAGEPLATVHYNDPSRFEEVRRLLAGSYSFSDAPVPKPQLIKTVIC